MPPAAALEHVASIVILSRGHSHSMLSLFFYQQILSLLLSGESFAIAMIVAQQGSTPRHTGSRMLIQRNGHICGSLGGGMLETQAINLAQTSLAEGIAVTHTFALKAEGDANGMMCGGEAEIFVYPLETDNGRWLELHQALVALMIERKRGWLITRLTPHPGQWLVRDNGTTVGVPNLQIVWLPTWLKQAKRRLPFSLTEGETKFLIEPVSPPDMLYIFGAGHIGQQLVGLAMLADFEVSVLDDRSDFASRERFPHVSHLTALSSYGEALADLHIDEKSFLVIVTHAHAGDLTLLRQALRSPAGYIGMIGSRHKRDTLYVALLAEGFTSEDLQRVHCPIGLAIGAETPAEIAVSIVAELIRFRAERQSCR